MSFNLLEEKWIPVLMQDGKYDHVSIMDALTQAGRLRQIAASNPMDRLAILRFLLALLYWCKGNPPTAADATSGNSFPLDWFSKLYENKESFNLLGEGRRFYQYRKDCGKRLTANYLIHEVPTGTNISHFRHSTDKINGLCRPCCAMGLLRLPLFATSGGRGKPPGVNQKPPIYAIPMGISLAKTLRLSWQHVQDIGTPAWESPDTELPNTVPLLVGLTWLPRRVWLDKQEESEAHCISCGRRERLILHSEFDGRESTKTDRRVWMDPHVIIVKDTPLHAAVDASDAAAGQWTKIMAGILRGGNAKGHLWVVGFATVQNDKYLEAMEYMIPFHCTPHQAQESVAKIERWQKEGYRLRKAKPPLVNAIRAHVESIVSARAGELLAGGDAAWEEAAREYSPMMAAIAKSLSPGFTTAAVERRDEIAQLKPDMRANARAAKRKERASEPNRAVC